MAGRERRKPTFPHDGQSWSVGQDSNLHCAEAPRFYGPVPYQLGVPRMAEGEGIEPPGAVPRRLSKPLATPHGLPSRDRCAFERERRVRESNPQAPWGPPRSRRLGMPMPNPPAEGEGIEPPLVSRPDRRVPSECLAARPTFHYGPRQWLRAFHARQSSGGSGNRTHAGITRPRLSKPVPCRSAIPPNGAPHGPSFARDGTRVERRLQGATSPPLRFEASRRRAVVRPSRARLARR